MAYIGPYARRITAWVGGDLIRTVASQVPELSSHAHGYSPGIAEAMRAELCIHSKPILTTLSTVHRSRVC